MVHIDTNGLSRRKDRGARRGEQKDTVLFVESAFVWSV